MNTVSGKNYSGLDGFRIIAAFLVVSIHTSVLTSFSEGADFWFTRILARTAVPFFIMVTGFFLLPKSARAPGVVIPTLKKLLLLYGGSMILYLPLNFYGHQFEDLTAAGFLQKLIFDGTFYHLWYFPAIIEGLLIVLLLQKFFTLKGCLVISFILYLTGLGGDSYYGLAEKLPILDQFYHGIFQLSSYTRNGIFMVPFFLCLGWMLHLRRPPKSRNSLCWFLIFLLLMTAEGFLLRQGQLQRHDSMYFFLIPAMYCLFSWLLTIRRPAGMCFRNISLLIYVIHPWMIVIVRMTARLTHLESMLIQQSLIHYLAVAFSSCILAVIIWKILQQQKKIISPRPS